MTSKLWRLSPSPVARTSFWILYLGWTMQNMPCMVASFEGHSCFYRTLQVQFLSSSKDVNYLQIVTLTILGLRVNGQNLNFLVRHGRQQRSSPHSGHAREEEQKCLQGIDFRAFV